MRSVDAQAIFLREEGAPAHEVIWHQNGEYRYCPRIS
jgi:hypothetical protein